MAFIETFPDSEINDAVRAMYARQEAFWGFVPNYAKVFATGRKSWGCGRSFRPASSAT